jgi:hypothetical protein
MLPMLAASSLKQHSKGIIILSVLLPQNADGYRRHS